MRAHDLQPKVRRRFIATTDGDHDSPIFPQSGKGRRSDRSKPALSRRHNLCGCAGPLRLRRHRSRRVVALAGYAIGRSIDPHLTTKALMAAIDRREPPPGLIHRSDRGVQGGFKRSSQH